MRRADLDFVADPRGAVLEGAGRGPALLLAVIAVLVIAFLAWASVATLEEITYGGGRVIPASDVQQIQSLDGGILVELLVHEGDRVEKDQVLMRVDDTGFASNYNSNRAQYLGLQAAAARLEAELADATPVFPEALVLENPALVVNETNLFHARVAELDSALNVLRRQVEQRQQELAEMQNRAERLKEGLALANKELGLLRPLVRQGAAAPMEELRLERAVNETQTTLETLRLTIPRLRSSITEAEQRIVEKKNGVRTAVLTELNDIKVKLSSTGEALKGLKDRVTRTDLRAPVAGLIKKIHQKTIGSVIQTGRTVIEIVPSEDTLMVEGRVRPADIAFLHPGQAARVKLTAYDFATYGALDGRLEHISADSTIDDKGESYYVIHVRTRADNVASGGKTLPIIPGMVADVSILTGKKTVMAYLLKPLTRGRDRLLTER